jgi:hypothetical protein
LISFLLRLWCPIQATPSSVASPYQSPISHGSMTAS